MCIRDRFNRLMNDIRTGRIKCLVVRDLSRFGRDYIEGVATRLYEKVKEKAQKEKCDRIEVEVYNFTPEAKSFLDVYKRQIQFHGQTLYLKIMLNLDTV